MSQFFKYSILGLFLSFSLVINGQNEATDMDVKTFTVRGVVIESDTYKPISKVNIEVNGGSYTTIDKLGEFRIQVQKGDELVIRHSDFETVFVTVYNHYAMEALNAHASYYLMKPIAIDDLIKAVDYITEIKTKENALQDQVLIPKTNSVNGKITIPQQDGFEILETANILYCKADDNYTEIFLNNNKKKLVSKTLKYFEEALSNSSFARVHKSFLVNVNEVVKYRKGKGGSVVLSNGKEVMVLASRKAELLSYFK